MGVLQKNGKHQKLVISKPEPPVTTFILVFLRTFTVMFLLCSAVMTHMCVLFRPWKQEWVGKPGLTLEFSVWHVCRATPKGVKCYDGEYDNAPGWFLVFRWSLMSSIFIQYFCVLFSIVKIWITQNAGRRHFWVPAFLSLLSAVLVLMSMLLLVGYREFEFLEESRMYRMGWRYKGRTEDIWAWPYYMSWCTIGVHLIAFAVCMFTESADMKYGKFYATEGLRRQAEYIMVSR